MTRSALFCAVALCLSSPALAASDTNTTSAAATQHAVPADQFVQMAAVSNMFEIQSSMVAKSMAKNADVKAFADQMIADHTKAGEEMKSVAPSTPPDTLDDKHQAMVDELNKAQGADFDKKYVDMQVQAHKEAVALFSGYAQNGDDADLKAFAAKTLPVLQQHYDHVQKLAKM